MGSRWWLRVEQPAKRIMRTKQDWEQIFKAITAGYLPGGKTDCFVESSQALLYNIHNLLGIDFKGKKIVDIGCGNGRLPLALILDDLQIESYTGLEIVPQCITFCQETFKEYSAYRFIHLDVKNDRYWIKNKEQAEHAKFPVETNSADLVICSSLFTHIPGKVAIVQYFNEIDRICKKDAIVFSTWIFEGTNCGAARTVHNQAWVEMQLNLRWNIELSTPILECFGDQRAYVARKV